MARNDANTDKNHKPTSTVIDEANNNPFAWEGISDIGAAKVAIVDDLGAQVTSFGDNTNITELNGQTIPSLGLTNVVPVEVLDANGDQINSLPGALDVNLKPISQFVQRNGPAFSLKGKPFKFAGFNYYPLINSSLATVQQLMDDLSALGVTVLRTWCFDPAIAFRNYDYALGTNLISNGTFETNTTGWTLGSGWTRSSDDAHTGTWSIKQVSASGFAFIQSDTINVSTNTDYVLTFWTKFTNNSGFPVSIYADESVPSIIAIEDFGFLGDTNGEWVKKQYAFNSATATGVRIKIGNQGGNNAGFYDDFHLGLAPSRPTLAYDEAKLVKLDVALNEARKRGIKLMLSLADGNENGYNSKHTYVSWANSVYGDSLTDSFPYYAFYTSTHCKNLYKDFIKTLAQRVNTVNGIQYKDDPAIFSWELGNELRANSYGTNDNSLTSSVLTTVTNWTDEISTYIKSVDPNHMVGFGDMAHEWRYLQNGSGVGDVVFNGTYYGVSYSVLSALPNIDYADYHIYPNQDDNVNLGAASGKFWGQNFGYTTISGDGLRAQLKDYVDVAHANNKPAIITEVGFVQGTTGSNTYYPLYNRYQAFKAIFTDFLDIPQGDGVLIWSASPSTTSSSYDIALEATGGEYVTDNSNDTTIINLVSSYNTGFQSDVTPAQTVTGIITTNGDIITKTINPGDSSVSIQLSDTWTGTVQFEDTNDGITWYPLKLVDSTGALVSSATAVGLFSGAIGSISQVRVRASAIITGSLAVMIQSSTGTGASSTSISSRSSLGVSQTNVTTAGTRVQLASNACSSVTVKAKSTNTGLIYVGGSSVSSSNGFILSAGDSISIDITNTNLLYIDSSVNGEGVSFIFLN